MKCGYAPHFLRLCRKYVLFRSRGYAKATAKQPTGLFLPPSCRFAAIHLPRIGGGIGAPQEIFCIITFSNRMQKVDIYSIVSRQ